jgi:hypothetical protein
VFLLLSLSLSPVLYFYRTQVFGVLDLMTDILIYPLRAMDQAEDPLWTGAHTLNML